MNNLGWGLQMTMLGMGLVFGLLALLWAMLVIVLRFDSEPAAVGAGKATAATPPEAVGPETADTPPPGATVASVDGMDADLLAAQLLARQPAVRVALGGERALAAEPRLGATPALAADRLHHRGTGGAPLRPRTRRNPALPLRRLPQLRRPPPPPLQRPPARATWPCRLPPS